MTNSPTRGPTDSEGVTSSKRKPKIGDKVLNTTKLIQNEGIVTRVITDPADDTRETIALVTVSYTNTSFGSENYDGELFTYWYGERWIIS